MDEYSYRPTGFFDAVDSGDRHRVTCDSNAAGCDFALEIQPWLETSPQVGVVLGDGELAVGCFLPLQCRAISRVGTVQGKCLFHGLGKSLDRHILFSLIMAGLWIEINLRDFSGPARRKKN